MNTQQTNKIKELTDFYMWMQKNNYNHNIRSRVELKAELYLNQNMTINEVQDIFQKNYK